MIRLTDANSGFSLVELTVSLGLTVFCLIALLLLFPFGIKMNQDGIFQTTAASVLSNLIIDLRATPRGDLRSPQYGIAFGTVQYIYLNDEGRPVAPTDSTTPPRYKITIAFPPTGTPSGSLIFISLKMTWPAFANSENNPSLGVIESFVALDRN